MAEPLYRQIADDLRRQIEAGQWPPGEQLPTELELREQYNASRNTVRDAVKWLIARGLIETRPGQGTFVAEKITPFVTTLTGLPDAASDAEGDSYHVEVTGAGRSPTAAVPRVEVQPASDAIAAELQLERGSAVVSRHQPRFIDGSPWSLQTSFYPMRLVEMGASHLIQATDIVQGTVPYLREILGIEQAGYREVITVRVPNEVEAHFFRLPGDGRVPVIETRRTAFDSSGMPIRLTVSAYPADRNQFAIVVGNVPGR